MTSKSQPVVDILSVEIFDPENGRGISRPVSFSISSGDLCVIAGPNGVGKSTLLHGIASSLALKSSASRVVNSRMRGDVRSRQRISVRLHPQLSAPMFALPLSLGDVLRWYRHEEAPLPKLIEGLDLFRPWDSASGGEKQRVLLSGLFIESQRTKSEKDFELLLLDEPGNHLDSQNREELRQQVIQWLSEGSSRSVVIVTHDPEVWNPSVLVTLEAVEK